MRNNPASLTGLLQVLGDPTRRAVVEQLAVSPRRAGELAASAGVSAATMSKHLRVLLEAGVLTDERGAGDARVRVFHLRPEGVGAMRAWLDQLQAQWDEQLVAFKRHVETSKEKGEPKP